MKVLFLDIDGVLNPFGNRATGDIFSSPCCESLNKIIREVSDLKIVISSAWRHWGVDYMRKVLENNKIENAATIVVDITGEERGIRGYQIQCWLDRNPGVTNMVILDDNSDMGDLTHKLVKTNSFVGLTSSDSEKAIDVLAKPIN